MLYIQSRADMTLGVIEEFYNDTHQMILSSGVSSYTFTVAKNIEDAQHLVEGNYVIVTDDQGLGWKFTIMNTTQTHTEITVYCEDIGLELVNKVMDAWNAPTTKQPASYYINKAIKDTKWKIGFNQISNLSRTLKWEGRDTSLNRLLSICTEFDHAEIEFRVKFHNLQVTDYIINIYKSRGANRSDIQLVYGETVNDITKSSSIEELATAMMGVGSDKELPENAPQGTIPDKVTFKNLTYDDGFFFTKMGDPFLRARVANQQFNLREGYIEDYYEYDTVDPQELLNRTITQLKERSEIKVNYEVSAVKFDKSLQLGDTITIIDHDYKPELLLSGRVLELDKSYTDASQDKLVLGNFLILYSNINDKLYNLQNQIKNMKVDSNYMWLRYAIDDKGTGMSATPTAGTKYFAMLVNKKTGVPSDNPADYTGHWKLIQGEDGKDGVAGEKGADGKTSYTHFAYANDVSGHSDFSLDDPTGRAYMGVFSDFTKADSTNPDDYIWSLTKGEDGEQGIQGLQGPQGTKGIAGPKGADGKTQYTHIAYSNSADGKTDFSQTPANHKYIGMYVDFIEDDSNDPTKYGWSLIKGEDGLDGAQGIAGPKGIDGKTSYTHIAYADTATGSGFSQSPNNKKYIGMYVDFTENDSGNPKIYAWSLIKGDDGKDGIAGKDGVGIKSTQIMYAQSTSSTTAPTAGWTAQVPTLIKGQYLWTQTTWLYTDNTGESGYTVSYNAKDGNTGSDGRAGKDGVGIKSTTITYATSTSGTSAPTSGWVSTPPSATAGQFIWTRTIWTYTDNTTETGYSVGKIGEKGADGANGVPGKPGTDGKTPYFHTAWATSVDGKNGFSITDSANKTYLGTYTDFTKADSTDTTKYAWSLIKGRDGTNGTPGKPGADGKTPYFHTAWADSVDGKINFSLTDATNRGYLGTYTDFVQADSIDSAKYTWTELLGNLQVGVRNLLRGTADFSDGMNLNGSNGTVITNEIYNGNKVLGEPKLTATNDYHDPYTPYTINNATGTTYALSFYARTDATNMVMNCFFYNPSNTKSSINSQGKKTTASDGSTQFTITKEWKQYWVVWETNPSTTVKRVIIGRRQKSVAGSDTGAIFINSPMLVEGNKAVGWQRAPEDVDDTINSLQTPNLVYNAGLQGTYKNGLDGWNSIYTIPDKWYKTSYPSSMIGGVNALAINGSLPANAYAVTDSKPMTVQAGNVVSSSISMKIEPDSGSSIYMAAEIHFTNDSGAQVGPNVQISSITNKTDYASFEVTNVSVPTGATHVGIRYYARNSDSSASTTVHAFWCKPVINYGAKVAVYSDNQGSGADITQVNEALVQANNKINAVPHVSAQSSAPTSPKKGDQWWVLDASGKATGFKVWNGSAWADSKIQQSLLNVVSLNAVTITGSTINGSKFTNNFDFTNIEKIRFQGVTTIGDGAVNITWKLPVNNQTGQSLMNASGFQSDINAPNGTSLHHVGLVMGLLEMTDWLSGSGSNAKFLTGVLDAQDAYHAETTAVQWLSGWGDWGNGNGLIHVSRNGRTVSVSGYPHHNNSANFSEVCNLPAWARPIQTVNISGTVYDSGVMNPAPCKITIDKNGKIQVTNGKKGGYLIIGGTYTGQDIR